MPVKSTYKSPSLEAMRLLEVAPERVAFLDVETNGLPHEPGFFIICITIIDGKNIPKRYVYGDNLPDFAAEIADYRLVVTFRGQHDLNQTRKQLGADWSHAAHMDLYH